MTNRAVVFDVDNTLYNFVDFFAPAFRAMVHTLAHRLGVAEATLEGAFKAVYAKYHSLEYRYAIQELSVVEGRSKEEIDQLVYSAHVAFSRSRRKRLEPYPGTAETLKWLRSAGFLVVAYTDSPVYLATNRLAALGVRPLIDFIVAWGPERSEVEEAGRHEGRPWFIDGSGTGARVLAIGSAERKPCEAVLARIAKRLELDVSESYAVGDSLMKDLAPARSLGFVDVWAEYGRRFDEKNWATLLRISPWHESVVRSESGVGSVEFRPSSSIGSIGELRHVVRGPQGSFFA